jgi:hypothetical protein
MVVATEALRLLPWGERPAVRIASVVVATGLAYAGLLLQAKRGTHASAPAAESSSSG